MQECVVECAKVGRECFAEVIGQQEFELCVAQELFCGGRDAGGVDVYGGEFCFFCAVEFADGVERVIVVFGQDALCCGEREVESGFDFVDVPVCSVFERDVGEGFAGGF